MGSAATEEATFLALPQRQKVVLVMDLVESVRLMEANEVRVIDHWRGFVRHATGSVLPRRHGRLVKSLGDGIMAEFDSAPEAVAAALDLHRHFDGPNVTLLPHERLYLRAGLNATHVFVDDIDIYGSGVNLAARVASLAGPGETMTTAEVRDSLTEGVDAVVEDMGECYLKHVVAPVRIFRIGSAGPVPLLVPEREYTRTTQPTVAVIPFTARTAGAEDFAIGELVADGVIAQLGRTPELKVISRLATTALRNRTLSISEVEAQLRTDYIVSGSYVASGSKLLVTAELVDAKTTEVLWVERIAGDTGDLLQPASEICQSIAAASHQAILGSAVQQAMYRPLPTLAGQALMFAGIAGVHQAGREGFTFSGRALSAVIDRHPRHAEAYSWLAKWHAIGANRGLQGPASQKIAADLAERAVQAIPDSAFALTVSGLVKAFFLQDLDGAGRCYARALALNPNEALAWLYTGTLHAWQGRGPEAAQAARRALELAPIGSMQYYVESLAGLALLCAGDLPQSIAVLRHSLRLNAAHSSTHRALAMALTIDGQAAEARRVAQELLRLEPGFTVEMFMRRYGGRADPHARTLAAALLDAGVPRG
ncbi:MAG: hypothetical protein JWP65_1419 [Ramlibacter sp.]|jgi:adenylate cyclase|nr:hypothetical protein [Ramlibacter sp.]